MTDPTNQTADLHDAFAALGERAVPNDGCPEPERLWAAVHGEASRPAVREILDHTTSCPACAAAWRMALAVQDAYQDELRIERASRPGVSAYLRSLADGLRSAHRPRWAWAHPAWASAGGAALALVVVVGLGWWPRITDFVVTVAATATGTAAQHRGEEASIDSLLPQDEPLSRKDAVLRWTEVEGATYNLWVTGEDFTPVTTQQRLEQPEHRIPESALAAIPAGAQLLWRVEAIPADGLPVESPTFNVTVD